MANLEKLSENKLAQEIDKRSAKDRQYLTLLIEAGFGDTTGNELDAMVRDGKASKLVTEARKASHAYLDAANELDKRMRYHGSEKPIKAN